jgi:hypothetical protein
LWRKPSSADKIDTPSHSILLRTESCVARIARALITAFLCVSLVFGSTILPAHADIFDTFEGVATDPLKLAHLSDRLQQTVQDALAQAQLLLSYANDVAEQRLTQIRGIVEFAIEGGETVEAKAFADLQKLELQLMADLNQFIFRARCAAVVVLNGTIQNAIAQALETLAKSQPSLRIIGIPIGRLHLRKVTIDNPNTAYFTAKREVLTALDHRVTDKTNAYEILSTYANVENLAETTRCFYLDKPDEITFVREQSRLEVEQVPWTTVVVLNPS